MEGVVGSLVRFFIVGEILRFIVDSFRLLFGFWVVFRFGFYTDVVADRSGYIFWDN